uniref:Ig-like domain-containing protein n=1 Tax=Pygocentrus nattereri TaxID=42514 RepID=A0A3B4CW46_PYGNA
MMNPAVMIVLLLYRIDSAQAVRHSEPLVISAEAGEVVNLTWTFVDNSIKEVRMCYKQRLEHAPLEVGSQIEGKAAVISDQLDKSRFKLNGTASGISLSIERVTKEDEGMYFCVDSGKKTLNFSTATFLAVTGQLNTSVLQTAVRWSVSPGESVTLQCTVMSEIRAADLRVLWFRAAAGQSFPEIIYTHQNSSSRQCEISSSTHSSVYNFSKNILDQHHTGTYYCAVAACGKIIFGTYGTSVELSKCSCALLGTCSIFVLFIFKSVICINIKRVNRKCDRNRFCNLCCKTTHHTLFIQYRH